MRTPELVERAVTLGLQLPDDDAPCLLQLLPLLEYIPRNKIARLLVPLLEALTYDYRSGALDGDHVSITKLVPLFSALEGEDGLHAIAEQIVRVAKWLP
jgi:hypothetical protein